MHQHHGQSDLAAPRSATAPALLLPSDKATTKCSGCLQREMRRPALLIPRDVRVKAAVGHADEPAVLDQYFPRSPRRMPDRISDIAFAVDTRWFG